MANRPVITQQFREPPPLPPSTERTRTTLIIVAIVVGIVLAVILALLLLNAPADSTAISDDFGKGSAGTGSQNGDGSSGNDPSGDSGSSAANNSTSVDHSDGVESKQVDQQAAANDAKATATTNSRDAQSGTSTLESPVEEIKSAKLPEPNKSESSKNNQFFTLGNPTDRIADSNTTEELRPEKTARNDAFSGRTPGRKEGMLRAHGGTDATEAAVKLGLEWLAKNQNANGFWSLNGPYENGSRLENNAAATAMALLAFQGAGHTHQGSADEKFTRVVSRGSSALLKQVFSNPTSDEGQGGGYTQAMCTMAICELYGMTHDVKLRKPAFQAVQYCLDAQSDQGGWRYLPRQDTDTSITGWFVMGLQSGRMAGLKVPNQAFKSVSAYLDTASSNSGNGYSYQPGLAATPSMTAEALLCRQYLGWQREDTRLQSGAKYLLSHLPDWKEGDRDVYYMYYATQVCHHMGGDYWQRWNAVMRDVIPANQVKEKRESGSWDPHGDKWGAQGGRLYVTCMCLYMLEVYYRYLPLYQENAVAHGP